MNETKLKTEFFFKHKILVHINTQTKFYNGIIVEFHEDMIIIKDRVLGDTPVFFSEIKDIERYAARV